MQDKVSITRGKLESVQAKEDLIHKNSEQLLTFSPTALEDYYRCPYRWFTSRRVGYNSMDVQFDVAAQGSLVHSVMEHFYQEFKDAGHDRVTPENLTQAIELAKIVFDKQLEQQKSLERRGLYVRTKSDELKCEELLSCVIALIERDATFLPGYIPTYFELKLSDKSDQPLTYAGVPVRGKVDRIDVDSSGNAIIIDYKLSGLSAGYGFEKKDILPQRIQTDIYAALVQKYFANTDTPLKVIGSVYRSYSKDSLRGVYDASIVWGQGESTSEAKDALPREDSSESYQQYLVRVEDAVSACISRMQAGNIEPNPISKNVCNYCKAILFCPKGGK